MTGSSMVEPQQDSCAVLTPIPLMRLATAFWAFKALATAVDMDLFTRLSATPMSALEAARWFRIEERPAEMLLTGCAGLGLLGKQDGRYCTTPLAEPFWHDADLLAGRPLSFHLHDTCQPATRHCLRAGQW